MFRKQFSVVAVFVLLIFGVLIGTQIRAFSDDNIYEQQKKFEDVLNYAKKYYVDDISASTLVTAAIEGLLKSLDPHSVYISPKQLEKVQEDFKGSFEGVGIEFNILNDTITVVSPIFGGPSEKAGIFAGDKIVKINSESAVKFKNEDVQKKLRGEKGTKVEVSIVRAGVSGLMNFEIIRDKIPLYSVDAKFMLDDGIGYMEINRFASTTYQEFMDGLREMRGKGMKKLILDLRNNPGGYLEQSFRLANEFLKRGQKIVYTRGRRPDFNEDYDATGTGEFQDLPIIILVNNASASASEIVSGAIQDHDRGLIVGETTFGKGLVQRQFELSDGSAFRLTTARYYTPTGRIIQRSFKGSDEEYYKEAYSRDEETSDNVEHKEASADTTSRPKFKTDGGRTVLGGGGVTPDYIVKWGRLEEYTSKLRGRIFEFTTHYMDKNGPKLRSEYTKDDVVKFIASFVVSDDLMQSFIEFGETKGVKFNKEQYEKNKEYLKALLRSQVARNLFGLEGFFRSTLPVDPQFQKAMSLFPEAKRIAGLK
jgi:carboxyl-terminal processing protease